MNEADSIHLQFEFTLLIFFFDRFFYPLPSIWVKFNIIQVIIYTAHEEEKACFVCAISFKLVSGAWLFLLFFFLNFKEGQIQTMN